MAGAPGLANSLTTQRLPCGPEARPALTQTQVNELDLDTVRVDKVEHRPATIRYFANWGSRDTTSVKPSRPRMQLIN